MKAKTAQHDPDYAEATREYARWAGLWKVDTICLMEQASTIEECEKKSNAKQIEEAIQRVPWLFAASESRKRWIVAETQRRAAKENESEAQPKAAEAQQKRRLEFQKITEDAAKNLKLKRQRRIRKQKRGRTNWYRKLPWSG